jgi:hypothetical protein
MRVQKGKINLFYLILCILALFHTPHSYSLEPAPGTSTIDTAAFEAMKRFGDQSTAHFLKTFYDLEGAQAVHLFLVTKNKEAILENIDLCIDAGRRLIEEGQSLIQNGLFEAGQNLITSGRTNLFQENSYGTLLISARQEGPTLIAFHHGLPAYVTAKKEAEDKADAFSNGKLVTYLGVLYLSPLEYYFEFEIENWEILVNPFSNRLIQRADLEKNHKPSDIPFFEDQDGNATGLTQQSIDDNEEPDHTGAEPLGQSFDSRIISGVPDYYLRPELPGSCGPTAGACLLGYWEAKGYENLVQGQGTYDDVTSLIKELCGAMGWSPSSGVYYSRVSVGLRHIINERGYEMDIGNLYGIDSLDIIREEIIKERPFIYGSQENPWGTPHYIVVVGYQENFIIVHDNWRSTPVNYFVNWDALGHSDDMITTLIPPDQEGPPSEPLPSDIGGSGSSGCFISTAVYPLRDQVN